MTLHTSTRVLGVTEDATAGIGAPYWLHLDPPRTTVPAAYEYYDYVVLAAPCPEGLKPRLRVEGGSSTVAENLLARCEPVEYQHVHATLVYGLLDPAYLFGGGQGGVGSGRLSVAELNGEISEHLNPNPKPYRYPNVNPNPNP